MEKQEDIIAAYQQIIQKTRTTFTKNTYMFSRKHVRVFPEANSGQKQ